MWAVLAPTFPAVSSSPSTERWIRATLRSSAASSPATTSAATRPMISAIVQYS